MNVGRIQCLAGPVAGAALALLPAAARADHPGVVFGSALGGPAWTMTADTLPQGRAAVSLFSEYRRFKEPSDAELGAQAAAADGHAHSTRSLWAPSLALAYGLSDRLTLVARLPYIRRSGLREGHVHGNGSAGVHELGDAAGLGDLSLGGHWRFWDGGARGAAALSLGSVAPTGVTHRRSLEGEHLDTEHQPGSGAWQPFVGTAFSRQAGRLGLHAHLRLTRPFEGAQDTRPGPRLDYGVALAWALGADTGAAPHEHAPGTPAHHHDDAPASLRWTALLELNGEYLRPQRIAGVVEGEREHVLFLAPGLRVNGATGWSAALSLGAPVYQRVGADHVKTDWRVLASVGTSF